MPGLSRGYAQHSEGFNVPVIGSEAWGSSRRLPGGVWERAGGSPWGIN
jgi:hypothetical protein